MQPMFDKELDKLFQDNFDSFVAEPSAGLWARIDAELSPAPVKAKKKVFPILWMAAASVLLVMGAGFYFMQPQETIKLQGRSIALNKPEVNIEQPIKATEPVIASKHAKVESAVKQVPVSISIAQKSRKAETAAGPLVNHISKTDPEIASLNAEVVKSNQNSSVTAIQPIHTVPAYNSTTRLPTATALSDNEVRNLSDTVEQSVPKRRIKSLGDLVNRIIARVDPREDKIIQFSDNDEGTEVSGINLGIIKFKHNHNK